MTTTNHTKITVRRLATFVAGLSLLASVAAHAAPTVSLSAPANNAKYHAPASLTVNASASPSSGTTISKVEFYQGSTLLGSDTTKPYSLAWANPPAGTYTLTAKATDSAGGQTTSAARTVTITASNTPPTLMPKGFPAAFRKKS